MTTAAIISSLRGRLGPASAPRVLRRKIALMYGHLPAGLAAGLAASLTLTFILPSPDGRGALLLWGLANVILASLRYRDCVAFRRRPQGLAGGHPGGLVLGAAAQGALWGLLGWHWFLAPSLDPLFISLVLACLAGGAVIFLTPIYLAYVVYVVPMLVPACVRLLAGGAGLQRMAGGVGLVYAVAMLYASARTSRWLGDALASAVENEDLAADLGQRKAHLEQQVEERTRSLSVAIAQLTEGLREKEQERLRAARSDANHLSLLQAINEGFGHVDARETFLFANPAAEKIFGVAPGTLVGRSLLSFMDQEGAALVRRETGTRSQGLSNHYLCPIVLDDGRQRTLQVKASPLHGADGQFLGASAVFEDITERLQAEARERKLQAELHHAQKLESIGVLAGGVAHDMNNILGSVQAIVQTLMQKHAREAGLLEELGIIERASTRGRDLVKSLTHFVRKELTEPEPLDLNGLVREEAALLARTILGKVALAVDLEEPLPAVLGERAGLAGVLMNLCGNALDAMPEGGNLALHTRALPDGWIELTLTDTGKGMPSEVLARAMEPFFTTKAVGKGTGLGLALAYATVKAHGGSMTLQSEVGRGTTVLVRLPAAKAPVANGPAALRMEPVGALRILQVDDDDLILASIPLLLELQGHTVTTATGGQEALDQLGGGLAVDLVILDLNMPGMNGLETLHRLRALRPGLPVLLATGYLDPGTEAELRRFGHALSIAKPFSMQELNGMLKRLTAQEST
jgi:PAS domain S-box-containing protein